MVIIPQYAAEGNTLPPIPSRLSSFYQWLYRWYQDTGLIYASTKYLAEKQSKEESKPVSERTVLAWLRKLRDLGYIRCERVGNERHITPLAAPVLCSRNAPAIAKPSTRRAERTIRTDSEPIMQDAQHTTNPTLPAEPADVRETRPVDVVVANEYRKEENGKRNDGKSGKELAQTALYERRTESRDSRGMELAGAVEREDSPERADACRGAARMAGDEHAGRVLVSDARGGDPARDAAICHKAQVTLAADPPTLSGTPAVAAQLVERAKALGVDANVAARAALEDLTRAQNALAVVAATKHVTNPNGLFRRAFENRWSVPEPLILPVEARRCVRPDRMPSSESDAAQALILAAKTGRLSPVAAKFARMRGDGGAAILGGA